MQAALKAGVLRDGCAAVQDEAAGLVRTAQPGHGPPCAPPPGTPLQVVAVLDPSDPPCTPGCSQRR
eukprot:1185814-Prorocentrum_minimum.AAC.4